LSHCPCRNHVNGRAGRRRTGRRRSLGRVGPLRSIHRRGHAHIGSVGTFRCRAVVAQNGALTCCCRWFSSRTWPAVPYVPNSLATMTSGLAIPAGGQGEVPPRPSRESRIRVQPTTAPLPRRSPHRRPRHRRRQYEKEGFGVVCGTYRRRAAAEPRSHRLHGEWPENAGSQRTSISTKPASATPWVHGESSERSTVAGPAPRYRETGAARPGFADRRVCNRAPLITSPATPRVTA
jgi:hypothetical protein